MTTEGVSTLVLVLHFASTSYMVGLVWFVQRVHYPLFAGVGRNSSSPTNARAIESAAFSEESGRTYDRPFSATFDLLEES